MGSNNLQTVQGIYEAFGRGDVPFILDWLADDVAWEDWGGNNHGQNAGVPWLRAGTGKAGAGAFFQCVGTELEFHGFDLEGILPGGDTVAALVSLDVTVRATGVRFRDDEAHVWWFNDAGKVTKFRHYVDTAKHIAAAKVG